MLAAARQTALHSAGPELLLEESTTAATAASPLRAAGAEIATVGATSGSAMAGLGSSVRLAVAESMSTFGRAEAAGGSLASQSLLVAEESLTTLRGDVSNAFQSGLEDVLDTNPINVSSVTDQAKTLLPSFQTAAA